MSLEQTEGVLFVLLFHSAAEGADVVSAAALHLNELYTQLILSFCGLYIRYLYLPVTHGLSGPFLPNFCPKSLIF